MGNVISPGIKVMVLAVIIGIDDTTEGRDSFLGKTAPTRDSSAWPRGPAGHNEGSSCVGEAYFRRRWAIRERAIRWSLGDRGSVLCAQWQKRVRA